MQRFSECDYFVSYAEKFLGTPYLWAGDDPSGLDCSGYVIECLKSVGKVKSKFDTTADGLLKMLSDQEYPTPTVGGLFFYMKGDKATHVGIYVGRSLCWSASGGNSTTDSPQKAWDQNAFIKQHPIRFENIRFVRLFDSETGDLI